MQRVRGNDRSACRTGCQLPRLSLLLVALAAAGTAAAQQTQQTQQTQPSTTADSRQGSTHTTYRVINLAPGLLASLPRINARGQVSFSMQAEPTAAGYFYDGSSVRDIGSLGGGQTLALDLNDLGQVTGNSLTAAGAEHAFVWRAGSGMLDIGTPSGGGESSGVAINRHGVVTGSSYADFTPRAFRWSAASGNESLGALTSDLGSASFAGSLNDAGLIAGSSTTADGSRHAFAWTRNSGLVDIDTLNSYDALVVAVGANGEVAGNHIPSLDNLEYRPFLWTRATGMRDLGTAGGTSAFVIDMTPGVHMAGLINFGDIQRAMSWTRSTGMRDLGTLGGASSRADGVNAGGQVVGDAQDKAGDWRAFVWTAKNGMLDLNNYLRRAPPGLVLDDALAINDAGAIVATSNAGLVLLRPDDGRGCGHLLGPVVAAALVKAGTPLQASVAFVDEDRVGTRSVSWTWGDGSSAQAGKVSESGGAGIAGASHSFAAPGIYRVTATVVDRSGRSTAVSHEVLVTAPAGGMAAGSGSVMSPAGAFRQSPLYAGTARFRLLAPLAGTAASASAAAMPARLQFDLPGLHFRSQDVRMLGRQGSQHVFEGSGTVKGAGNYRFRLSTSATLPGGGQGSFALKIWHTNPASKREVVDYDNARGQAGNGAGQLANGRIVLE